MLSWTTCPACGLDFEVHAAPVCPRCGVRALSAAVHREGGPTSAHAVEAWPPPELHRLLARWVCLLATVAFVLEVAAAVGATATLRMLRSLAPGEQPPGLSPGELVSYVPGPERRLLLGSILCLLGVLLWHRARALHAQRAGEPRVLATTLATVVRQLWVRDGPGGRLLVLAGGAGLAGWPLLGALAAWARVRLSLPFSFAELVLCVASALAYALTVWRLERSVAHGRRRARR